jgi:hypothetical protein
MKTIVCGLLLLISATVTTTAQKESTMGGLVLAIREVNPSGVVKVEIDNSSKKPIRVWDEANMWGASHWRVLLIRNGRLETFFENPDQQFTMNYPRFDEIAAGAKIDRELSLNNGNWCGFGHCSLHNEHGLGDREVSFERGDILIAIYDVPKLYAFPEARDSVMAVKAGVWSGVATAMTVVQ